MSTSSGIKLSRFMPRAVVSDTIANGATIPMVRTNPISTRNARVITSGNFFCSGASAFGLRLAPQRLQYFSPGVISALQNEQYILILNRSFARALLIVSRMIEIARRMLSDARHRAGRSRYLRITLFGRHLDAPGRALFGFDQVDQARQLSNEHRRNA